MTASRRPNQADSNTSCGTKIFTGSKQMTESEMEIHQRIDVMGDRIEELEKIVDDQVRAFTVAVRLIADLLEKKNGV